MGAVFDSHNWQPKRRYIYIKSNLSIYIKVSKFILYAALASSARNNYWVVMTWTSLHTWLVSSASNRCDGFNSTVLRNSQLDAAIVSTLRCRMWVEWFYFIFLRIKVAVLDGDALVMTSAHGLKEKRWLTDSQFSIGRDGHNRCHDGDGHQQHTFI